MTFQGVEVEVTVECGEGQTHPVRLRYTAWRSDAFEVVYNPCQEKLGEILGEMAPCMKILSSSWHYESIWRKAKYEVIKELAKIRDPQVIPMLLEALQESDSYISFLAADLLGNFPRNAEIAEKLIDNIEQLTKSLNDSNSYDRPNAQKWRIFLTSSFAFAKIGVLDPLLLARLRAMFLDLAMEYYKGDLEFHPSSSVSYALRAIAAILSLTGNIGDFPLVHALGLSEPFLAAANSFFPNKRWLIHWQRQYRQNLLWQQQYGENS